MAKRRGPKLVKPKAKKVRATETPVDHGVIVSTKQAQTDIDEEDKQFERYLEKHPSAKSAFSSSLIGGKSIESDELSLVEDVREDLIGEDVEHVKELEELKERDPSFYQFLLENDKELLGFGKKKKSEEEEIEPEGFKEETKKPSSDSTLLTLSRFEHIVCATKETPSVRSLSLLLAAYRGVIRSVAELDDDPIKKSGRSDQRKIPIKLFFHVEVDINESDDAFIVFNEVVSNVLGTVGTLIGTMLNAQESGDPTAKVAYPKPQALKRRFQILLNNFWSDTILLLRYFCGKPTEKVQTLEQVTTVDVRIRESC